MQNNIRCQPDMTLLPWMSMLFLHFSWSRKVPATPQNMHSITHAHVHVPHRRCDSSSVKLNQRLHFTRQIPSGHKPTEMQACLICFLCYYHFEHLCIFWMNQFILYDRQAVSVSQFCIPFFHSVTFRKPSHTNRCLWTLLVWLQTSAKAKLLHMMLVC